jgi:hypothetical protein
LIPGSYTLPIEDHGEHGVDGGARGYDYENAIAGCTVCTVLCGIDVHERGNQPGEGIDQPGGEEVDVKPLGIIRPKIPEPADCACINTAAEVTNRESMG